MESEIFGSKEDWVLWCFELGLYSILPSNIHFWFYLVEFTLHFCESTYFGEAFAQGGAWDPN